MRLESEAQRELILKCLANTQVSGVAQDLFPILTDIANLVEAVKTAPIETKTSTPLTQV
jgi:hypothetical protein